MSSRLKMLLLCFVTVVAMLIQSGTTLKGAEISTPALSTETTLVSEMEPKDMREKSNNYSVKSQVNVSENGPHRSDGNNVGCKGLRSKRYISDEFCRMLKPISEVLCTGYCVPERFQAWYPEFMQVWGKTKVMEYRCVDGVIRHQRIKLMCDNGKMRSYKIRVVKSCACRKQFRPPFSSRTQNHQDPAAPTAAEEAASMGATAGRHDRRSKNSKTRQTLSNA